MLSAQHIGYLGATLTQVFVHARRADVSLRDVTIARHGKRRLTSANDVTHRKRVDDLGRFWKSQWVEMRPDSGEDGWFSLARGDLWWWVPHELGGIWKKQNRNIVPLSPYVEKPLNSKVIKSFEREQRSPKCFSCFEIPMFYVIYIWTLYVHLI